MKSRSIIRGPSRGHRRRLGAVLLEVIMSMGLLIFGMAVVGLQINAGLDAARASDTATRGVMLADTKMAELAAGIVKPEKMDDELKGDFGILYPGYTWRVKVKQTDLLVFNMVTLEIGYNRAQAEVKIGNPEEETDFELDGTRIIRTAYRLLPIPADVNLSRDFGLSDEELTMLSGAVGDGSGENGNGNGNANGSGNGNGSGNANANANGANGNNAAAGGAGGDNPLNKLLENLGPLKDLKSFDPRMLSALPPDEFKKIADLLSMLLGRGNGGAGSPEDLFNDLLKEVPGGGKKSGGGGNDGSNNDGSNSAGNNDSGNTNGNNGENVGNDTSNGGTDNSGSGERRRRNPRGPRRGQNQGEDGGNNNTGNTNDNGGDNDPGGRPSRGSRNRTPRPQ